MPSMYVASYCLTLKIFQECSVPLNTRNYKEFRTNYNSSVIDRPGQHIN